jgi:NADP-reducing hydrogenase subunit HndB
MSQIKSLEDLKRVREEALAKRELKAAGRAQITVGMGTCGIAAGARDAMKAILDSIEAQDLSGVVVTQTGCVGLCEHEPIVEVTLNGQPKATYGKVTPERARQIVARHVVGSQVVKEWLVA